MVGAVLLDSGLGLDLGTVSDTTHFAHTLAQVMGEVRCDLFGDQTPRFAKRAQGCMRFVIRHMLASIPSGYLDALGLQSCEYTNLYNIPLYATQPASHALCLTFMCRRIRLGNPVRAGVTRVRILRRLTLRRMAHLPSMANLTVCPSARQGSLESHLLPSQNPADSRSDPKKPPTQQQM